jgi:hypothetical protein
MRKRRRQVARCIRKKVGKIQLELEEGLVEKIIIKYSKQTFIDITLNVGSRHPHWQRISYTNIPFKCHICWEHVHLQYICPSRLVQGKRGEEYAQEELEN